MIWKLESSFAEAHKRSQAKSCAVARKRRGARSLLLGWFLTLWLPAYLWTAEPIVPQTGESPEALVVLRFAEDLMAERDFYRAITEYKRFLSMAPQSTRREAIRLRIGQAYLEGDKPEAARMVFEELASEAQASQVRAQAQLAVVRCFLREGRFLQARSLLIELDERGVPGRSFAAEHAFLRAVAEMRLDHPQAAQAALMRMPAAGELGERGQRLLGWLGQPHELPHKSPALAGVLSVLPGLGHVYLGEGTTALTAFLWNGVFGYATFDAFQHKSYGVGALLAGLSLFWYTGTIYGAVTGAERYNRDARLNQMEQLENEIGLDVAVPQPKHVELVLWRGRF